jgi:DNA modification methylase
VSLSPEKLQFLDSFVDDDSAGRKIPPTYQPHYSDIVLIPRDKIIIPDDRQRGGKLEGKDDDYEGGETLKGLTNSIKRLGFAIPIHVTQFNTPEGRYTLVCGNRRAVASAGLHDTIPSIIVTPHPDDPNPKATLEQLEFSEDIYRLQRDPLTIMKNRKRLIDLRRAEGQLDEQIADEIGIVRGTLSDSYWDADFLECHPDLVAHCKTPKEIGKVRRDYNRARDQERLEEMNRRAGIIKPAPKYEIRTEDCLEWVAGYDGPPFDLIHCDFPYRIGQDTFNQSSRVHGRYPDSPETFETLFATLLHHLPRLLAPDGVLTFWHAPRNEHDIRQRLREKGLYVPEYLFFWVKPNEGILPRPGLDLRQCTEQALVCSRGKPDIIGKQNWFAGPAPNNHQSGKNEAMLEYLFSAIVKPTSRVLDPACGSGVAIRVAKKLKVAYALGLEINDDFALLGRAALERDE